MYAVSPSTAGWIPKAGEGPLVGGSAALPLGLLPPVVGTAAAALFAPRSSFLALLGPWLRLLGGLCGLLRLLGLLRPTLGLALLGLGTPAGPLEA